MISREKQRRKFRFTKKGIDALPAHDRNSPSANQEYSDEECIGLRVFVSKNGRKTYHLRYRYNKRKRIIRLGEFPAMSVVEARTQSYEYKNLISRGEDPLSARKQLQGVPTLKEFARVDYIAWAKEHKKSWTDDERILRVDIIPVLGHLQLSAIVPRDVQQYLTGIKKRTSGPTANRHFAIIAKLFRLAAEWDVIEESPCQKIKKFKESSGKERFMSGDEISRLLSALAEYGANVSSYAIQFLLYTGMRKSEALRLRWDDVDLEKGTVHVQMDMAKSGRSRHVAINSLAKEVLKSLVEVKVVGNHHVFPGAKKGAHLSTPNKLFVAAKKKAGIENLRLHDLRHSYASLAVAAGASLYSVQKTLGHSSSQMTQRYAHLCDKAVQQAAEGVADEISDAIGNM